MRTIRRKILRAKAVKERTGYSRVQIWRKSRDPEDAFPAPVQLGPNAIGWFDDEITTWLENLPRVNWAAEAEPAEAEPQTGQQGRHDYQQDSQRESPAGDDQRGSRIRFDDDAAPSKGRRK